MRRPLAGLRLGVLLLFVLGLMSPIAATGVGAQDLTCDDFNSERAAQAVLDADPSLEDVLDPEGDGIACNEDEASTGDETPVDEETPDDEETPVDEETPDDNGGSEDGEAYVADIQDEIDTLSEQIARFLEIDSLGADATQDDVDELLQIAEDWSNYPDDVASQYEAPEGYEDVEDAYLDLADTVGEMGDLWDEYWATESGSTEEEDALDAFNEAFISAQDQIIVVQDAIDEAGGGSSNNGSTPTEEATEESNGTGADSEFLATIQDELDTLSEQSDRFTEIYNLGSDATADDIDEINQIAEDWSNYPDDVAAEIPESTESEDADIYDAYLDLADAYGEAGDLWAEYWDIPSGDAGEEEAFDAFSEAFDEAQSQLGDVQDLIDEAGGSSGNNGDDPTEEATEEATEESSNGGDLDADAEEYLTEVQDTADAWNTSIDRVNEIIGQGADSTDADNEELVEIVQAWLSAPDVAAEATAPDGYEDVQEAYEAYADSLATAGDHFTTWVSADPESQESDDAITDFILALADAQAQYDSLNGLITDAGL